MKQEKNANTLLQIRELVREYILPRQHIFIPPKPVSYTHLTLPTIYSV